MGYKYDMKAWTGETPHQEERERVHAVSLFARQVSANVNKALKGISPDLRVKISIPDAVGAGVAAPVRMTVTAMILGKKKHVTHKREPTKQLGEFAINPINGEISATWISNYALQVVEKYLELYGKHVDSMMQEMNRLMAENIKQVNELLR